MKQISVAPNNKSMDITMHGNAPDLGIVCDIFHHAIEADFEDCIFIAFSVVYMLQFPNPF